jgi:hypothetical protein
MSRGGKSVECELGMSVLKSKSAKASGSFWNVDVKGLYIIHNVILL